MIAGQPGRHALKDRGDDLYETAPEAVHALLDQVWPPVSGPIWEPACGPGAISSVLAERGHEVVATDLVDYSDRQRHAGKYGVDFLLEQRAPVGVRAIITNPPYKLASEFVRHATSLRVPRILMLLRLAYLEAMERSDVLEESGLFRVNVFRNRLPMMHRDGWTGKRTSSTTAYAWFDWHPGAHTGPPSIARISWRPILPLSLTGGQGGA